MYIVLWCGERTIYIYIYIYIYIVYIWEMFRHTLLSVPQMSFSVALNCFTLELNQRYGHEIFLT